jgi:Na+-translocating ferredoxin:NAD+ oxidoreductase RnfE subunit
LTRLERPFLAKVYLVSALLTLSAFFLSQFWFSFHFALGVAAGGFFAIANTHIIAWLTSAAIDQTVRIPVKAIIAFTVKVPIVWGLLILAFASGWFDLLGFVAGFQVFVLSLVLTAIRASRVQGKPTGGHGEMERGESA